MLPAVYEGHPGSVPKPQEGFILQPVVSTPLEVAGLIAVMVILSLNCILSRC